MQKRADFRRAIRALKLVVILASAMCGLCFGVAWAGGCSGAAIVATEGVGPGIELTRARGWEPCQAESGFTDGTRRATH